MDLLHQAGAIFLVYPDELILQSSKISIAGSTAVCCSRASLRFVEQTPPVVLIRSPLGNPADVFNLSQRPGGFFHVVA